MSLENKTEIEKNKLNKHHSTIVTLICWSIAIGAEHLADNSTLPQEFVLTVVTYLIEQKDEIGEIFMVKSKRFFLIKLLTKAKS